MKKLFYSLLAFFSIISCGEKEEKNDAAVNEDVSFMEVKEKGPEFRLRYKFKNGDKFSYKLKTISDNTEEIKADTAITNSIVQSATYIINFNVKNINPDKSAEMDVRISSIKAETNYNGQSVKYDSKLIYSTRERVQFVDYEAVKNIPFRITVNGIGQVVKVEKIDKIMRNILEIQKIPDTLSAKTRERMRFNIANGTLMPLTQQIFKVVSEKNVGVDSVWQLKYNTPLAVFSVENTAVFKITEFIFDEDTTANISSNLLINVTGNNIVNEEGLTYTFSKPNLTATGNVIYNLSKGLVKSSESVTTVEMTMYIQGTDNNNNQISSSKNDYSKNTNIVELL